jgi:isopentenyl diphosphate isomerase/L-lactate dehydrogenase-like FMN-dependent dehydrogenase
VYLEPEALSRGFGVAALLDRAASRAQGHPPLGGRQLDSVLAGVEALRAVVEAVGGRAEVYLDGGVRRGVDVLKALALGARAVFVGRPVLWGLAVDGATGVRRMLRLLREELKLARMLAGLPNLQSVGADLL